ncbi:ATP-binding protein [soil metagenome]
MNSVVELILIRGTPGSGKSSLARRLKKKFPDSVLIELDNIRGMMNNVDWESDQQHDIALHVAAHAAKCFLESGRSPIIIADIFLPEKLNLFLKNAGIVNYRIITLLINKSKLQERYDQRKEGFTDLQKGIAINQLLLIDEVQFETKIETSEISKEEVSTLALCQLNLIA